MNNFDPNFGHQVNVVHVNTINTTPTTYYTYGPSTGQNIITEQQIDVIADDCLALPREQVDHYRWDGPADRNYTSTPRKRFFQYRGKILQLVSETPGQEAAAGQITSRRSVSHDLTEEELRERRAKHAERERMRRKNMTPEQRAEYLRKESERRQKNKERINKARYERNHANWEEVQKRNQERYQQKKAKLSDEERKERVKRQIERQKQKMAQMTPEELEAFKEKMREIGRQRYAKKKEGEYNPRKPRSHSRALSISSSQPPNDHTYTREPSLAPSVSTIPGGRDSSIDPSVTAQDESFNIRETSQQTSQKGTESQNATPEINKEKKVNVTEHMRHCMLYEFQLGHNVVEATQNIRKALGQNAITQRLCQQWFNRFKGGNIQIEMIKPSSKKRKLKVKKIKNDPIEEPKETTKAKPPKQLKTKTKSKPKPIPKIKIKLPKKSKRKSTNKYVSDDEDDDISVYSDNSDIEVDIEDDFSDRDAPSTSAAKKTVTVTPSSNHKYPTRTKDAKRSSMKRKGSSNELILNMIDECIQEPAQKIAQEMETVNMEVERLPDSNQKGPEPIPELVPEPMSLPAPIQLPDENQAQEQLAQSDDVQTNLRTLLYGSNEQLSINNITNESDAG